ncbi:MAG: polysaccharide deacetylase family protein [Bacteroidota bacterium]|nr:MAG: polysaccharide deacetylase family protein [Bacteroidota bacterium]
MIYWNTPRFVIRLFNRLEWHYSRSEKTIYLTFDDGPTPEITPRVLELLAAHKAKATFFCLGRNVERHPDLYSQILNQGHAVGNHTYSHLKGWKSSLKSYIQDISLAAQLIQSKLFRPPYGRIRNNQVKYLSKQYRIIMWDVLSHDYNTRLPAKMCLRNVIRSTRNGSVVVFHDSKKAAPTLLYTLPLFLEHFTRKGFIFRSIV